MSSKNYSRRDFIGKTTAGLTGATVSPGILSLNKEIKSKVKDSRKAPPTSFASAVERLPVEELYDYHKRLSNSPVHIWRRDLNAVQEGNEMAIPDKGWKITLA